jgi:cell division septal protein FtsQ
MTSARPAAGRRAALSVALVALIVAIPVALFFWGRTSDSFAVKRVVVSGERRLPKREVRRLLTARFEGENLFTIGAGDVRSTLSRYPYVADVDVDRDFPDTLRIRLTEHEPAALILSNGAWYVLSSDGRVLAQLDAVGPGTTTTDTAPPSPSPTPAASGDGPVTSPAPAGTSASAGRPTPLPSPSHIGPLPVPARSIVPRSMRRLPLMETDAASVVVGTSIDDARVSDGLELLSAMPPSLRRTAAAARVVETSAKVFMRDGLVVEFGAADDLDTKVLALQAVIKRYRERHVRPTLIDVSVPSRPLGAPLLPTPGTGTGTGPG